MYTLSNVLSPLLMNCNNLAMGDCESLAGPFFIQRISGSIPALVDVSLNETLNPELLPVGMSK